MRNYLKVLYTLSIQLFGDILLALITTIALLAIVILSPILALFATYEEPGSVSFMGRTFYI